MVEVKADQEPNPDPEISVEEADVRFGRSREDPLLATAVQVPLPVTVTGCQATVNIGRTCLPLNQYPMGVKGNCSVEPCFLSPVIRILSLGCQVGHQIKASLASNAL